MGKCAQILVLALVAGSIVRAAPEQVQPATPTAKPLPNAAVADLANRVAGYTAWDDEYLYIAVKVNKPTLAAKNSAPFSRRMRCVVAGSGSRLDSPRS